MLDDYKDLQPTAYKTLVNAVKNRQYSHAYLFETHGYFNAKNIAFAFIKALLCPKNYVNSNNCADCKQCQVIDNGDYIEISIIEPDGLWIKKEQLSDLQSNFSKKAINGDKRIYVIMQAERLNDSAANSLLKFLEEPADNIIAILLTDSRYQLLSTIVSRCQIISIRNQEISTLNTTYEKIKMNVSAHINEDMIKNIIHFVDYYEKNGIDTFLYTEKLWHQYFNSKDELINAFEIMFLYYVDALNLLCLKKTKIFLDYLDNLSLITNNNTINSLIKKINIVMKFKEYIKFNINNNLLVDRLILELEEV